MLHINMSLPCFLQCWYDVPHSLKRPESLPSCMLQCYPECVQESDRGKLAEEVCSSLLQLAATHMASRDRCSKKARVVAAAKPGWTQQRSRAKGKSAAQQAVQEIRANTAACIVGLHSAAPTLPYTVLLADIQPQMMTSLAVTQQGSNPATRGTSMLTWQQWSLDDKHSHPNQPNKALHTMTHRWSLTDPLKQPDTVLQDSYQQTTVC